MTGEFDNLRRPTYGRCSDEEYDDAMRRYFLLNSKIIPQTGCMEFTGSIESDAPIVRYKGKRLQAYRVSYMLFKGGIAPGLVVRHTCDNNMCINSDHLILGTQRDNMRDAMERNRMRLGALKIRICDDEVINQIISLSLLGLKPRQILEKCPQATYKVISSVRGGWAHGHLTEKGKIFDHVIKRHTNNKLKKISDEDARKIKEKYTAGETASAIAREYNVSRSLIAKIGLGTARRLMAA